MKVTNSGLVFRWIHYRNQWSAGAYKYKGDRGTDNGRDGYRRVKLFGRWVYVHRLVCRAFHGPAPSQEHEVNHKNSRPWDNRASNLEWVTPAENSMHRRIDQALVLARLGAGLSISQVAREFGVHRVRIWQIKKAQEGVGK